MQRLAAVALPGNLLEIQSHRPHPDLVILYACLCEKHCVKEDLCRRYRDADIGALDLAVYPLGSSKAWW